MVKIPKMIPITPNAHISEAIEAVISDTKVIAFAIVLEIIGGA